jgi:hypothetical protein
MAFLDVECGAPAVAAGAGARDQLDLEVELVARVFEACHLEPVQADETGKVGLHPLFLLAPRSITTQSLVRAADVLSPTRSTPAFSKTRKCALHAARSCRAEAAFAGLPNPRAEVVRDLVEL